MRASILIPTHEHASTLRFAVNSVVQQGVDDIEILIVGDGVDDATRAAATALAADDPRIRFFDRPKGPRLGETHRDAVLRDARGRIVCYQCDDDLWLPGHLQAMEAALETADFAGAMQIDVSPQGAISAYYFDLRRAEFTTPWRRGELNRFGPWANDGFGLAFTAHRRDAYLRLPEGWTAAPAGSPSDQFMWHKFVQQNWCRTTFVRRPVSLHFAAPERRGWTPQQRADELARWSAIIAAPDAWQRIHNDILEDLGDRLLESQAQWARRAAEERAARLAMEGSVSWRLTAPLRAVRRVLG